MMSSKWLETTPRMESRRGHIRYPMAAPFVVIAWYARGHGLARRRDVLVPIVGVAGGVARW